MSDPVNPFQQVNQGQVAVNQQSSDIPSEQVVLPSAGKLYPPDHGFCNAEAVDIRTMTARDEDIMTSPALLKAGTVLTKLLGSCLMNKSVDPDSLILGDRNALLVAIRITGYGAEYSATTTCPLCSEESKHDFVLNDIKIKRLGAEPIAPNRNEFAFTLPISKTNITFKLLTNADELEIAQAEKRKKKLGSQVETSITDRLLYSIVSIAGDADKSKIHRFVMNMPAGDARALRKHMDAISPNVDLKQKFKCKHCSEESEVSVPIGMSFFWPDLAE